MKILAFIWKGIVNLQRWFIIFAGCIITILVFIEVMLRYVFASPLFGVEELIVFIAMWLYFIGASYGAYERSHIKADLIQIWFKTPKSLAMIHTVNCLITVILSMILVSWTYPYILWSLKKGGVTQALLLPRVYSQSAIFVASILMMVYFFVEFMDHLRRFLSKDASSDTGDG
jgi:TRAP-type C4-dicarboxylate transport system permease small subunit